MSVDNIQITIYASQYAETNHLLRKLVNNIKQYIQEILFLLGPERRKLPGLLAMFTALSVLDLAGVGLIGPYVSLVINPNSELSLKFIDIFAKYNIPLNNTTQLIYALGGILLCIFLIKTIAAITINFSILNFSYCQAAKLRARLMTLYQNMPYSQYTNRNSSEYIYAMQTHIDNFIECTLHAFLRIICEIIIILVIFSFLAWTNGTALLLLMGLLLSAIFFYDKIFRIRLRKSSQIANQYMTKVIQAIQEGIEGLKEIRVLGKEKHFQKTVTKNSEKFAYYVSRNKTIITSTRNILELLLIAFVVIMIFSILQTEKNLQTVIPMLGVFGFAAIRLIPSANMVMSGLTKLRSGRHATQTLYNDCINLTKINHDKGKIISNSTVSGKNPIEEFHQIILKNIQFSYPASNTTILENINLEIKQGLSMGIIGTSGAGKSTLVDLILGLLKPKTGSILFNNTPLQDKLDAWRSNVIYLPQKVFLTDDTLRRNIALGEDDDLIDEQNIHQAIKQAQLLDLVKDLQAGLDTIIGENGIRLSGGQRQRVALARAFYYKRNVLILDEATSALDNQTEQEIVQQIWKLKSKKTLIIIAHRLSTVQHCDIIYKLNKGKIVEKFSPHSAAFKKLKMEAVK